MNARPEIVALLEQTGNLFEQGSQSMLADVKLLSLNQNQLVNGMPVYFLPFFNVWRLTHELR